MFLLGGFCLNARVEPGMAPDLRQTRAWKIGTRGPSTSVTEKIQRAQEVLGQKIAQSSESELARLKESLQMLQEEYQGFLAKNAQAREALGNAYKKIENITLSETGPAPGEGTIPEAPPLPLHLGGKKPAQPANGVDGSGKGTGTIPKAPPLPPRLGGKRPAKPSDLLSDIRGAKEALKKPKEPAAPSKQQGGRDSLLQEIRKGVTLKPASERELAPAPEKKPTLLEEIRSGTKLKPASQRPLKEKPARPKGVREKLREEIRQGIKLRPIKKDAL